jgi:aminopeptidase
MNDIRWSHLADILINYSTATQPRDNVLITMMEIETFPLARFVHAEAIKAGAYPQIEFQSAYLEGDLMRFGNLNQLDWVPEMQIRGMDWADVYIGLRGARNPHEFAGISTEKIVAHRRAMGVVSSTRNDMTRWVLARIPNESFAQQAGMSLDEILDFFFTASIRDWAEESIRYHEIAEVFQAAETVRILGDETDLSFSTKGRRYEVADGHINMPDGEIFTAPVDDSADGYINFEFPGVYTGRLINDIYLEFSKGRVTKASATSNEELLLGLIHMDQGSDRIGEFGVGTNFGIDRFCFDILYDEKIGGTIHIALGRAYSECGGVNKSALHWDIVKDLRYKGEIYLDNQLVFKDGTFLV